MCALLEHLKAQHVDGDIPLAEVRHDTLGAGVQPGRDDDDLVALVERLFIQRHAEVGLKVRRQIRVLAIAFVDGGNIFGGQFFHPRGIVECLRHHITRGAVALEFDQH
ncbi:hypothetical protein D3C85_1268890 [compost metagenome]